MTSKENYVYSAVQADNDVEIIERTRMSENWDKFTLLIWKNWILQYRKPLQTAIEILAPVLFSVLLVVVRNLVEPTDNNTLIFEPFCPTAPLKADVFSSVFFFICDLEEKSTSNRLNLSTNFSEYSLLYAPRNEETDTIMDMRGLVNTIGFNTSEELNDFYRTNQSILAALEFGDIEDGADITVKIRLPSELRVTSGFIGGPSDWKTNLLYPIYQMRGPRSANATRGGDPSYANELFLAIQEFMTMRLLSLHDRYDPLHFPFVHVRRFPYYKWTEDPLLEALQSFAGCVVMVSFCYTCTNLVRMVTTEKEKQLKEAMKMMGLPNWLHWLAWFVKSFSFLVISSVLITVLLKVKWYASSDFSVLTVSDPTIILVFFLLYICSIITFCFAISVFFSKANTAATVSALIWFISYTPYFLLRKQYDSLSLGEKLSASIGMNCAMAYGLQIMLMFEGSGEGSQWHNLFKPGSPDDTLSLGLVFMMLIVDTLMYLLIALYVEAVLPGEFGVPKPWYFFFTRQFWCEENVAYKGVLNDVIVPDHLKDFFEKEPRNLTVGIKIRNLRKVFKGNVAVDDLSLNMYENQITVLLGHNGAGKTTTMSMLTGMFPPTSGTAIINNYDIRTDMNGVRTSLGLCPQHNILFDELTVEEHLYFYSKLKGNKEEEIQADVRKYLNLLELGPKAKAKSSTLSGGMKRKLCVGIALCGNSKVVMLDEPSAGMDPSARRSLWELIQSEKEGRTILLTTHFMDEADLLGDRIAIMAGGRLKCCGSSFFLKKKYGTGYNLIMDKSPSCDPEAVKKLLQEYISNIEIESNIGSELSFLLPEEKVSVFEIMFKDLEKNQVSLGVNSYGVSLTTLEEVFMKVGADHDGNAMTNLTKQNGVSNGTNSTVQVSIGNREFLTGSDLVKNQYLAMTMKKLLSVWRTWRLHLFVVLIPVLMMTITMLISKVQKHIELPAMTLELKTYQKQNPIVLIESEDPQNEFMKNFKKLSDAGTYKDVNNITVEMLRLTQVNPPAVRHYYLTGASFGSGIKPVLTAWFNNDAYHTAPISLGMILNSIYQDALNDSSRINFVNHPLPYKLSTQFNKISDGDSMGFNVAFNLGFSMSFVAAFFILFYVRERVTKSKHLQFVSGAKVFIYWTTAYVYDMLTFTVVHLATICSIVAFQEEGFSDTDNLVRIFILMLAFSYSVLPLMYAMSYFFEIPSSGYTRMSLFGFILGDMVYLVIQLLKLPLLDLLSLAKTLHWIFLAVPHYALCTGVLQNYNIFAYNKYCSMYVKSCETRNTSQACMEEVCDLFSEYCCKEHFQWESPGISSNIAYMVLFGTFFFCLVLLNDYKMFNLIVEKLDARKQKRPTAVPYEDDDVTHEKMRIRTMSEAQLKQTYTLAMKDVTRYYGNLVAVNGLCLGIKEYECFGLLGINGAGKTTTFMMLTGDVRMTYGKAWVKGLSINNHLKEVQRLIGYCPQFDALLDDLTARESLKMFCLLRGIRRKECNLIAEKLAHDFDFVKHLDKQVKELSGGNKRKLSTAIALIGDPPVLYLDEPTTGMDPATKRYLWNALCAVRNSGKCVVLTSHSMEECEALCTKIAVMVNGNFKCLGSTQHLKSKFAEGYTLTVKAKKADDSHGTEHVDTDAIKRFIEMSFRRAQLTEEHQELITYYVLDKSMPWSTMFGILERGKKELNIEDYSLGQSSLEQVFLTFTKHQHQEGLRRHSL